MNHDDPQDAAEAGDSAFRIPQAASPKPVIGICGAIGAGKSAAARAFGRLGCRVIDSDAQAHRVLETEEVADQVRRWLGPDVYDQAGRARRGEIARRVFDDPEKVARLNGLIHPRVHAMRREELAEARADPDVRAVVLDTPLLFEAGVDGECDAVVFIDAPPEQRRARLSAARGWDEQEIARRSARQMDAARKKARSDYVIANDAGLDRLARRVEEVLEAILSSPRRGRKVPDMQN